ncbi:hypothetical protein [Saccharospirillum mangrovi]|uniref:hypothetical protein n=1 Tax=Saccharospirillum mangrovi TaxID=2161747 RepID=UPI000D39F19B|nr:hypothetical protein [Saccharospirillum mangrovi]
MKTAIVMTTSLVAFTATGALADDMAVNSQVDHETLFEQFDANSDSVITAEEAAASMTLDDQFDTLDEDGSGDLTLAEFENLELTGGMTGGSEDYQIES